MVCSVTGKKYYGITGIKHYYLNHEIFYMNIFEFLIPIFKFQLYKF